MPATLLSHQALVLPLKMRWPASFSGLALCIGSMVPDFEFIWRMTDDWVFSHTMSAQLWFTMPVTVLLVWAITALLLPSLLPYCGEIRSLRLHDLAAVSRPSGLRAWLGVGFSGWIGGMSHVLLDAVTHGNHTGWLVPHLPVLRTPVWQFGTTMPLHDVLQVWLTVLLAIATLIMWRVIARGRLLWQWRQRAVEDRRTMPRASGIRLAQMCLLAALLGSTVGYGTHREASVKGISAAMAFGALDFVGGALLLTAVSVRSGRRSIGTRTIPHTAKPSSA